MIVKTNIANLERVKSISKKCNNLIDDVHDGLEKRKRRCPYYIRVEYSIGHDVNRAQKKSDQIEDETREIYKILNKLIDDVYILVEGEKKNESLFDLLKGAYEEIREKVGDVVEGYIDLYIGAVHALESVYHFYVDPIKEWLKENEVLTEIIKHAAKVIIPALIIAVTIASGGAALPVIAGFGVMMIHNTMELTYDIEALTEKDPARIKELLDKDASDYYEEMYNNIGLSDDLAEIAYGTISFLGGILRITSSSSLGSSGKFLKHTGSFFASSIDFLKDDKLSIKTITSFIGIIPSTDSSSFDLAKITAGVAKEFYDAFEDLAGLEQGIKVGNTIIEL